MGLLSFLRGRGGGGRRDRDAYDDDGAGADAWEAAQDAASPYRATAAPPLEPRAPRAARRPKLTDSDRQVFQYARNMTAHNTWYYRDRLNVPRGPCTLPILRDAWVHGVIDENTLVWGHGLMDWLPVRNVRSLVPQIRTVEVQIASFIKKKCVLEPALKAARRQRAEARPEEATEQVKRMY